MPHRDITASLILICKHSTTSTYRTELVRQVVRSYCASQLEYTRRSPGHAEQQSRMEHSILSQISARGYI